MKLIDQFTLRRDVYTSTCIECSDKSKVGSRARWLLKRYGLTEEEFEDILIAQDYKCGLCRRAFSEDFKPHVDHDHRTLVVRGALCAGCNSALGRLGDDEAGLQAALDYVLFSVRGRLINPSVTASSFALSPLVEGCDSVTT
jgi:hypothetical protein